VKKEKPQFGYCKVMTSTEPNGISKGRGPDEYMGKLRKCPCCGRMIYSKMEFTGHKNLSKPLTKKEIKERDERRSYFDTYGE
jgi:hypothetical protein